jgi:hypothetical protein
MVTEYSILELNYSYKRVEYQEYEIKYSYDLIAYGVAEYNAVWSIEAAMHATTGSITGYWSDSTQLVGNNLPLWHAGRYSQTGNYQQVLNSYAMGSEENRFYFGKIRRNAFIGTADTDDIYSGHICNYPKEIPDISDRQNPNLIYNSNFAVAGRAIPNTPCRWAVDKSPEATTRLVSSYSLSAGNALEIRTNSGEYANVYQSYNYRYPKGQDLVLSAMVNVPNNLSTVDNNASGSANLMIEALYVDGTISRSFTDIPLSTTESGYLEVSSTGTNTSVNISQWHRINTVLNLTKPTAAVKCFINSNYSNQTSDFLFYADCIQLEEGDKPTRWKNLQTDNLPWIYSSNDYALPRYNIYSNNTSDYTYNTVVINSNTSYLYSRPKTQLFNTVNDDEFYYQAIPTRLLSMNTSVLVGINNTIHGNVVGIYDTLISNLQYVIDPADSSKIKKQAFELNDDHGSYSIAERDYFGTNPYEYTVLKDHYSSGSVNYSLEIRALTFNGDNIVALCKESVSSNEYYTFKFIKPQKKLGGTYFECIQDYRVSDTIKDVFTGIETGSVKFNSISKLEGEKNKFIIRSSDGVSYEALFAYDYYIDADNGQFLTREKYDQICIT